jgi:hypothetical protein
MTSTGGLRPSILASQEPGDTPLRLARRTTPLAAMIIGDLAIERWDLVLQAPEHLDEPR